MLGHRQPIVDEIANEAKQKIDQIFVNQPLCVETSATKTGPLPVFSFLKSSEDNFAFFTSDRIPEVSRDAYERILQQVLSTTPPISRELGETIINVYTNYFSVCSTLLRKNHSDRVADYMKEVVFQAIRELITTTATIFSSPEKYQKCLLETNTLIQGLKSGNAERRMTAMTLEKLEGPSRIFSYMIHIFSLAQIERIVYVFPHVSPQNHADTKMKYNRLAQYVSDVMCMLYETSASQK